MKELEGSCTEEEKRTALSQERGLTILEVLAVIAIVGLLAAILLPVLSGVMDEAKQTKCMSNLRQLGVGMNAYVAENAVYPLNSEWREGRTVTWEQKIMEVEYPEEPGESKGQLLEGVFRCPSVKVPEVFRRYSKPYTSYGYNTLGLGGDEFDELLGLGGTGKGKRGKGWAHWLPPAVRSGSVMEPSKMAAMGPGVRGCGLGVVDGQTVIGREHIEARLKNYRGVYDDAWQRVANRHEGEANLVFVDGHVDTMLLSTLMRGKSDRILSLWNRDGKPHRERLCH